MLTCINHLKKKEINCHDSDFYWPTPINDTIEWFPFPVAMEYTANVIKTNKGIIFSLL